MRHGLPWRGLLRRVSGGRKERDVSHVLVTGGSGFIGSALVAALAARGDRVTGIDVAVGPGLATLAARHAGVTAHVCEITEWE